jgi:hypothetical protein
LSLITEHTKPHSCPTERHGVKDRGVNNTELAGDVGRRQPEDDVVKGVSDRDRKHRTIDRVLAIAVAHSLHTARRAVPANHLSLVSKQPPTASSVGHVAASCAP